MADTKKMQETKYRPEFCQIAAKVLADGESVAAVCDELDIVRDTYYTWKKVYPEFNKATEKGLNAAQRKWEKMGNHGIHDPKNFSAAPWIFTMKNRFRKDYGEQDKAGALITKAIEKLLEK